MRGTKQHVTLEIDMPSFTTLGDLQTVKGLLFEAATTHIDWEALYHREEGAVSVPGTIAISIADAIGKAEPTKGQNRNGVADAGREPQPRSSIQEAIANEKLYDDSIRRIVEAAVELRRLANMDANDPVRGYPVYLNAKKALWAAVDEAGL